MAIGPAPNIAIWAITANGLALARRLAEQWPGAVVRCSRRLAGCEEMPNTQAFQGLIPAAAQDYHAFDGHIFIMATGIVVRAIAPLLKHKTVDPAVVVLDDQGRFAISLVAGHIGGANELAVRTADLLGSTPVITTATDVNAKPAIDLIAVRQGLKIENPEAIKTVNMALLNEEPIRVHDPCGLISAWLPPACQTVSREEVLGADRGRTAVYVDDAGTPSAPRTLILRPGSLVAGVGCNRGTPKAEIRALLEEVLCKFELSLLSIDQLASIDVKRDESGLLALGEELNLPLQFYSREKLNHVRQVPNPSAMVAKHVGVQSVCEAAAILASKGGHLVVPKHKTQNVTLAIARHSSMSSASVREV